MEVFKKAKCGVCEQPMKKSIHVNMVMLNYKPTWKYPVTGNVLYDVPSSACAVVCDTCIDRFNDPDDVKAIKFAIELQGENILYHDVNTLEPIEPQAFPDFSDFIDEGDGLSICPKCRDVETHGGGLCNGCRQQQIIDKYY